MKLERAREEREGKRGREEGEREREIWKSGGGVGRSDSVDHYH